MTAIFQCAQCGEVLPENSYKLENPQGNVRRFCCPEHLKKWIARTPLASREAECESVQKHLSHWRAALVKHGYGTRR